MAFKWIKVYYWNVRYDMPNGRQRTFREGAKWVFLWPWYMILRVLARAGFLDTPEGTYMRLRDFTPFFWRVLINRAVESERKHWKYELSLERANSMQLLETARREAKEEIWEYLVKNVDKGL